MWDIVASRQGIWYSHLTLCLTLNFIFGYCFRTCPDLKITLYVFYLLVTWPWRHKEMFCSQNLYFWCQWKENLMQINIFHKTFSWFLSVFGLLTFKKFITWPWYKGWICFSHKSYRVMYYWKVNFMLINACNRT